MLRCPFNLAVGSMDPVVCCGLESGRISSQPRQNNPSAPLSRGCEKRWGWEKSWDEKWRSPPAGCKQSRQWAHLQKRPVKSHGLEASPNSPANHRPPSTVHGRRFDPVSGSSSSSSSSSGKLLFCRRPLRVLVVAVAVDQVWVLCSTRSKARSSHSGQQGTSDFPVSPTLPICWTSSARLGSHVLVLFLASLAPSSLCICPRRHQRRRRRCKPP